MTTSHVPASRYGLGILHRVGLKIEPGILAETIFGFNPDIDTGTAEDVWGGGGDYTGQPNTDVAETLDVYSSDAADNGTTTTGARTIKLWGLDGDYVPITETVTLNGQTHVVTTQKFWRMWHMKVLTAGSGEENAGIITAAHTTTTANVFAKMPIGYNETQICATTVPAITKGLLIDVGVSIGEIAGATATVQFTIRDRPFGGVYNTLIKGVVSRGEQHEEEFQTGVPLESKTDLIFRVDVTSANNTEVEARFELLLVDI